MTKIQRISKRRLREFFAKITSVDQTLLNTLHLCRYMTSAQMMRLHFPPQEQLSRRAALRRTNRHLERLGDMGLMEHLPRRVGGVNAGSGANIWRLTTAGQRLLRLEAEEQGQLPLRPRLHIPSPHFLTHTLAISEVFVQLHEYTRETKTPDLLQLELEPDCWRKFSDVYGKTQTLRPDLYATVAGEQYEDSWFLEVDLATESPAIVLRKCEQYTAYLQSGEEQAQHGVFPRVVWIVPNQVRQTSLRRHIAERFDGSLRALFVVITLLELPQLVQGKASRTLPPEKGETP